MFDFNPTRYARLCRRGRWNFGSESAPSDFKQLNLTRMQLLRIQREGGVQARKGLGFREIAFLRNRCREAFTYRLHQIITSSSSSVMYAVGAHARR